MKRAVSLCAECWVLCVWFSRLTHRKKDPLSSWSACIPAFKLSMSIPTKHDYWGISLILELISFINSVTNKPTFLTNPHTLRADRIHWTVVPDRTERKIMDAWLMWLPALGVAVCSSSDGNLGSLSHPAIWYLILFIYLFNKNEMPSELWEVSDPFVFFFFVLRCRWFVNVVKPRRLRQISNMSAPPDFDGHLKEGYGWSQPVS